MIFSCIAAIVVSVSASGLIQSSDSDREMECETSTIKAIHAFTDSVPALQLFARRAVDNIDLNGTKL